MKNKSKRRIAVGCIGWLGLRVANSMCVERWSQGIGTVEHSNYPTISVECILNANPRVERELRWQCKKRDVTKPTQTKCSCIRGILRRPLAELAAISFDFGMAKECTRASRSRFPLPRKANHSVDLSG